MRRRQKYSLLELTDTLAEAHGQIKQDIKQGNTGAAAELLSQCQECAVTMGGIIEESEGEGTAAVGHLEDYCEKLYGIAESFAKPGSLSAEKAGKILSKSLITIENSIKNDIPLRTEVVFLPYKASMWDSLESVWKKADADPSCDAYVIPIPYYDRNPDGSAREEHYEGGEYPEYVPVTDYRKYDFENRRPDKIYIHNPYDDRNFVTSVNPYFYSSNLQNFTDELIYIPYFVLAEPNSLDLNSLEGIKHFVTVPGVINADRVIVQSENMRKAYIELLTDTFGEETRKHWEEKISGEGSPKFDKVINAKKDEADIPPEWEKLILKPDGSRKKIIFYNTSVQALLDNDEKMLDKIQDALRIFKENEDSVVLLWRPHPLIKATISSMKPALWERYEKIVEAYRAEGWGIYDDSADLDRAIIISDAYYGDMSSVVQLYTKTEKPIMIQNADILEGTD